MNRVDAEACRIWQLPRPEWREAVKALPVTAGLHGVDWPLRAAVIERLVLAEKLESMGHAFAGWPPRERQGIA